MKEDGTFFTDSTDKSMAKKISGNFKIDVVSPDSSVLIVVSFVKNSAQASST